MKSHSGGCSGDGLRVRGKKQPLQGNQGLEEQAVVWATAEGGCAMRQQRSSSPLDSLIDWRHVWERRKSNMPPGLPLCVWKGWVSSLPLMMGERELSQWWGEGHTFGHINFEIFVSLVCTEITNIKLQVLTNFFLSFSLSFLLPLLETLGFMRCNSLEIQRCVWPSGGSGPAELSLKIPTIKAAKENRGNTKLLRLSRWERILRKDFQVASEWRFKRKKNKIKKEGRTN